MAKTLSRELSQSPYYTRNIHEAFSKILFKPGFALQSSELIELQDIVQNQIKRLSNHIFEDGSIVEGTGIIEPKAKISASLRYNCFLYQLNDDATTGLAIPKDGTIRIGDPNSTNTCKFIKFNDAFYEEENDRYYPTLLAVAVDRPNPWGVDPGDDFYWNGQIIGSAYSSNVFRGRYVSIEQSSIFYVSNYFVVLEPEDYIFAIDEIESFDTQVGIEVAETIITVDDTFYGNKLLDPAQNSFNANSPGADRLRLNLQLNHYPLDHTFTNNEWKFYPLIKYQNGEISFRAEFAVYSDLGETLARRTKEINGDFVVDDFDITLAETNQLPGTHKITEIAYDSTLKANTITVTGVNTRYTELTELDKDGNEITNLDDHYLMFGTEVDQNYNRLLRVKEISSDNEIKLTDEHYDRFGDNSNYELVENSLIDLRNERYLNFELDPGKAYVNGFRFQTTESRFLERKKARLWYTEENKTEPQNKEYFLLNTANVHFMNEGQNFQNLDFVDVHSVATANVHLPNTATTYGVETIEVTANSVVNETVEIRATTEDLSTKDLEDWDYVQLLVSGTNTLIEETMIYNTGNSDNRIHADIMIMPDGNTQIKTNDVFDLRRVQKIDKELALYNSTNFGKLRIHTSKISGNETELHFSHWLKEPFKEFTVSKVDEDLANNVVKVNAKTMYLSEKNDAYNDLWIHAGEDTWQVKNYLVDANNTIKQFELNVPSSIYVNSINVGDKVRLCNDKNINNKSLVQLSTSDYDCNLKAELKIDENDDERLKLKTEESSQRFNIISSEAQEVKSVSVRTYSLFFYNNNAQIDSTPSNTFFVTVDSCFDDGVVPVSDVAIYAKTDILDATNTNIIAFAGERITANFAEVETDSSSTKKLKISLSSSFAAYSKFIVHATIPVNQPKLRRKNLKLFTDEFQVNCDSVGDAQIDNIRHGGGGIFSLKHADIYRIRKIWIGVNKTPTTDPETAGFNDMTLYFDLDDGQRDTHYDLGSIHLRSHLSLPKAPAQHLQFHVEYEYFEPEAGHYFTVDSYSDIHYRKIPNYGSIPLRNVVDYRPVHRPLGEVNSYENELALYGNINLDYDYYAEEKKSAFVHKHDRYTYDAISLNITSRDEYFNSTGDGKVHLYDITVPAYTFNLLDVYIRMIDNRNYTMKDISKLQKRLENLEDIVQLNSLELQALQAKTYSNTGDPAFANGLLVDMFAGYSVSNFEEAGFRASIDLEQMELHPGFQSFAEKLDFVSTTNVSKMKNVLLLPKTSDAPIFDTTTNTQDQGTISINSVTPIPKLSLHPFSNIWYNQQDKVKLVSNEDNQFKNWKIQDKKKGHGTQWADWEQFWSGVTAEDSITSLGSPLLSLKTNSILNNKNNIQRIANGRKVNTTLSYPTATERIGFVGEMLTSGETHSIEDFSIAHGHRFEVSYPGSTLATLERNFLYRKIYQKDNPQVSAVVQKIIESETTDQYYFYVTNIVSFIFSPTTQIQGFTGTILSASREMSTVDDFGIVCGDFVLPSNLHKNVLSINLKYSSSDDIIASSEFHTSGLISTVEDFSKSIRPVQRKMYKQASKIEYIEDQTNVIHAEANIPIPMHQPFILSEACMISGITLNVSGTGKVITTVRPFVNGNISPSTVLPFSEQVIDVTSGNQLVINYDVPIYIPANQVYAVTFASTDSINFEYYEENEHANLLYSLQEARDSSTPSVPTNRRLKMQMTKAQFDQNEKQFSVILPNVDFDEEVDEVRLNLNTINVISNDILMNFEWKSKSYDQTVVDSFFSPIEINKTIRLRNRKEINSTTFQMNVSMKSNDANFSPMLDLERFYLTMIRHEVDQGKFTSNSFDYVTTANNYSVTLEEYQKVNNIDILTGDTVTFAIQNGVVSNFNSTEDFLLKNKTFNTKIHESIAGVPTLISTDYTDIISKVYTEYNDEAKKRDLAYRYYSPEVVLKDQFEAMQIHLQTDAFLHSNSKMYVYYRIKEAGQTNFSDYQLMNMITSSNKYSNDYYDSTKQSTTKPKLLEFNTRRDSSAARFKEFQIKIRFISSDYVNAPVLKNIRIIALDN